MTYLEAAQQATACQARLLVSIHCNGSPAAASHGTEVWYYRQAARQLAELLVCEVDRQIAGGESPWLTAPIPLRRRGVKEGTFHVLTAPKCLAVLVEAAFITNPREEGLLRDRHFLQAYAQAVADGVAAWVG